MLIVPVSAAAMECEMNPRRFDYLSTSPSEFGQGNPDQVKGAYRALLRLVPDPSKVMPATQYFVEIGNYMTVTGRKCGAVKCRGEDTLQGLVACSEQTKTECRPLAAIKDGKIYCTLSPAFEHLINQPVFKPFD